MPPSLVEMQKVYYGNDKTTHNDTHLDTFWLEKLNCGKKVLSDQVH